ncbi:MAG: hypothetical protein HYY06_29460 [Deltaproteobacteria bacterium]|nr:hypothetical protein [Deltaproteobacteria bacterium]
MTRRTSSALLAVVATAAVGSIVIGRSLRLEAGPPVPAVVERWVVAHLRSVLEGRPPPARPSHRALDAELPAPLVASVFLRGRQELRVFEGGTLGRAVERAGRALAKKGGLDPAARIRVEVPTARSPLIDQRDLLALSLVAGEDGLGAERRGKVAVVTKWELIGRHLYDRQWVNERLQFEMGVGIARALALLAADLGVDEDRFDDEPRGLFRFRSHTILEGDPGVPLQEPDTARLTRPKLVEAARQAARWCQAVLGPTGKYTYLYDPIEDREDEGARYSLPRHAGTTYYLAQFYRHAREPGFDQSVRRALDWIVDHTLRRCGPGPRRCVRDEQRASLGSAALAVVAMAEYRHGTGDDRYDHEMRAIGQFIRDMQKPNGDFHHRYSRRSESVQPGQLLYYTGEAILALLKLHEELGDRRDLEAARRGLDFLTGPGWDFPLSPYFFSEEHWTCIAANEAYPRLRNRRYLEFCDGFARFRRDSQYGRGATVFDSEGSYGFGTFVTPRTTPTASTTEAMVSTALLHRKWGRRSPVIERQVFSAVRFLLRRQLGPQTEHLCPDPRRARGGFPASAVDLTIRIDYTQHAGSAILRSAELLP